MLHVQIGRREEVDSRLLVVGSQTASLTPGPSFAHNLGYRCLNCQSEGIFDIYVSRPFQWHQEHPNARCFALCCWALNIRESRKTPNLQLFQVLGFTPTLGQSGVATVCDVCLEPEASRVHNHLLGHDNWRTPKRHRNDGLRRVTRIPPVTDFASSFDEIEFTHVATPLCGSVLAWTTPSSLNFLMVPSFTMRKPSWSAQH
jgi:hypothetical protein